MIDNNRITQQIENYIAYKHSLGYVIKIEAQELRRFAKYTREIGYEGAITAALSMQWASLNDKFSRLYMARRLETLHTFAVYISAFDEDAQVPQNGVFGKAHSRTNPYIYSEDEVQALMQCARCLNSPDGIRGYTVASAIGLMYTSGIRTSELTSLKGSDVRLNESYLFIRNSKFKKDRIVPLHPSVVVKLSEYTAFIGSKLGHRNENDYFYVTSKGHRLTKRSFEYAFTLIRSKVFSKLGKQHRLYDFRHSFACNTIKRWLEAGEDVNQKLYLLSTYMGHIKPEDTYWYLSATPELLQISAQKFANHIGGDDE